MTELTKKQETDIFVAKVKIENKGVNAYATKLSETDLKRIEKIKKFLGVIKYKSTEIEITPEYARQVIIIDSLGNLKNIFENHKDDFIHNVGQEEFDLIFKNVYYALNIYKLKIDEEIIDNNIEKLVQICENRLELKTDYYGKKYTLNPLFEQEKNFLKALLVYSTHKISNYQNKQLSTALIEIDSNEMDK